MTHAKHVTPYRRKRAGKTNYKKRLSLLKSGKPRLVIRRSNKSLTLQLVTYHPDGDKVLLTLNSKVLKGEGWLGSVKNLPAAYATGFLFGKRARELKVEEAIVDMGFHHHRAGTRIYAAVKGVIDSGLSVPVNEAVFPPVERLSGSHLSQDVAPFLTKLGIKLAKEEPVKSRAGADKEGKEHSKSKAGKDEQNKTAPGPDSKPESKQKSQTESKKEEEQNQQSEKQQSENQQSENQQSEKQQSENQQSENQQSENQQSEKSAEPKEES